MLSGWKAVAILAASTQVGGCVAAGAAAAGAGLLAVQQQRTVGRAIDDAYASNAIKARLLAADASYQRVDVEVADGRVLMTGAVPSAEHRIHAERLAWEVPGVEAVANEIVVGPREGLWRSAQDELITARVRARLVRASAIRAIDFNIETNDGVVYLMGLARSADEARIAAEAASRTPGVTRVISYVTARPERASPPPAGQAPAASVAEAASDGAPLFPR